MSAVAERVSPFSGSALDFSQDFFSLFGLKRQFSIDTRALERAYIALQKQFHPDRFAAMQEHERRAATQWSIRVNEGYRELRDDLSRAIYLLSLLGTSLEENPVLPGDFLMMQLELREALEEIEQSEALPALDQFKQQLKRNIADQTAQLSGFFEAGQRDEALKSVYALQFLKKLEQDSRRLEDQWLDL